MSVFQLMLVLFRWSIFARAALDSWYVLQVKGCGRFISLVIGRVITEYSYSNNLMNTRMVQNKISEVKEQHNQQ